MESGSRAQSAHEGQGRDVVGAGLGPLRPVPTGADATGILGRLYAKWSGPPLPRFKAASTLLAATPVQASGVSNPAPKTRKGEIRRVLRAAVPEINACYRKFGAFGEADGQLPRGRMVVSFAIEVKESVGRVQDATVLVPGAAEPPRMSPLNSVENFLPNPLMSQCVLGVLTTRTFDFPRAEDGFVSVQYPFKFAPGAKG